MSSVIELRPKRAELAELVADFRGGSYSECVRVARGRQDGPVQVVHARALLRLDRPNEALDVLSRDTADLSTALRGEFASLSSVAAIVLGRLDEARSWQRDARAYLYSVDEAALEVELHFFEARLAFAEGDFHETRRHAEQALAIAAPLGRRSNSVCYLSARADVLNLIAIVELSLGNRVRAVQCFTQALSAIASSATPDVGLYAKLLSNLAGNFEGLEIGLEHASVALVRRLSAEIAWTPELAKLQFYVVRELGWASALGGDSLSAFRQFKSAYNLAPSAEYRLQALLDRVYLGRELEQYVLAHADLLEAQELSMAIDWTAASELECGCLRTLALLLAPIDLPSARSALRAYMQKQRKNARTSTTFTDEQFFAERLQAEAAIALAEGRTRAAESLNAQAFEIFDRLGIRWRAANAALDLKSSSNATRYITYARAEALNRPHSWLATRVASA